MLEHPEHPLDMPLKRIVAVHDCIITTVHKRMLQTAALAGRSTVQVRIIHRQRCSPSGVHNVIPGIQCLNTTQVQARSILVSIGFGSPPYVQTQPQQPKVMY